MKLYYTPSACSLASHIVLNELGLKYDSETVDLKTHKTAKGEDFYKINPKGYVPVLVLDNGQMLTEGVAILTYLTDLDSSKEKADRYQQLECLVFIATELHKTISSLFGYKEAPKEIITGIKDKVAKRFDFMDKKLANREFVIGKAFGPADAYLFTVLNWCPHLGIDLGLWKNLVSFVKRIQARPAVQKTLQQEGI
ncbi:MAG: glutathione transferase GstA [Candidatus Omnitrophica bacterium]|nr:glutathione transferase GstA [Candidatus Omnitrophota bacterium]